MTAPPTASHAFSSAVGEGREGKGSERPSSASPSPGSLAAIRGSNMHDFCFTIPYGLLVLAGGIVGFALKGSTASLAGGAGAGLVLILAGFLSLKAFGKRRNSYLAIGLETGKYAWITQFSCVASIAGVLWFIDFISCGDFSSNSRIS